MGCSINTFPAEYLLRVCIHSSYIVNKQASGFTLIELQGMPRIRILLAEVHRNIDNDWTKDTSFEPRNQEAVRCAS